MVQSILIVEDHDELRLRMLDWLKARYPQLQIFGACDGDEALRMAARNPYSLVLMDIRLPGKDGISATRELKRMHPNSSVIVITGLEGSTYEQDAFAAGARAFVRKDKMYTSLLPVIENILQ